MLVGAARLVMAELAEVSDPAVAEPVGLLAQVIEADTEPDPGGGGDGGLRLREGVAPDRIVSVSDPKIRHGRKSASRRFDGHKMDVITDEASELVLGVDVRAGNAADGEAALPLLDHLQSVPGLTIATVVGDMAYSDGDLRAGMEQRGVDLVAKVPPLSNAGRYPKTDFYVDLDAGEVACRPGRSPPTPAPGRDHKGRPVCCSVSRGPSAPPARCVPTAPPPRAGEPFLSACITSASKRPEPPSIARKSDSCCATGPRSNERSTICRTWACAKPATGADGKPNIKASWPPRWPTSAVSTYSAPSANPPHSPRPPEPPARPSPPPHTAANTHQAAPKRHRPPPGHSENPGPSPHTNSYPETPKRALPAD